MEGKDDVHHRIMEALENALKSMAKDSSGLHEKLAPILAALLHTAPIEELG